MTICGKVFIWYLIIKKLEMIMKILSVYVYVRKRQREGRYEYILHDNGIYLLSDEINMFFAFLFV